MQISIITASYNYENYIKETIESVIAQTYPNWEMIIVDDGSKDNSVEVIRSYCEKDNRIKLFQHEGGVNKGLVETVKLGIEKATNDWVVFLESDDTITPDYLETKLKVIKNNPDVKFIFNDVNMFGDEDRIHFYDRHFEIVNKILSEQEYPTNLAKYFIKRNFVATFSIVMLKKEILEGINYDTSIAPQLDWYLWTQLAVKHKFYYINQKLTNWRMHKDSYISVKYDPIKYCIFEIELKNIVNADKRIFSKIIDALDTFRYYFLRIHLFKLEIKFMGRWYRFKKSEN